jgi:chemotaxis signal transduction protein
MSMLPERLRSRFSRRREMVILFRVGTSSFAIAANAVEEIRDLSALKAYTTKLPKVEQTLDRQNRQYFVVDAAKHFRMTAGSRTRVMLLRHTPVAVKVDGIERMQEIHSIQALPEAFKGEERNWYRGLTLIDGQVVPVVRSEAFLTKAEVTLLKAGMQNAQAVRTEAVTA